MQRARGDDGASAMGGGKMPPHNVEVERQFLSAVLQDPACLDDVAAIVGPSDFWRAAHAAVYEAVRDLHDRGRRPDGLVVYESLEAKGLAEVVGGLDGFAQIAGSAPHAGCVVEHAHILRQKAVGRRLIEACNAILRSAYAPDGDADALCSLAEEAVFAATDDARVVAQGAEPLAVATEESLAGMRVRLAGEVEGVESGFPELDQLADGFQPGQMTVLAARPSMGKTAMALNMADHAARAHGTTLFVSLEMGRRELGDRYLAMRSGVDAAKLKLPYLLSPAEDRRLREAHDHARASSLSVHVPSRADINLIAAESRRLKAQRGLKLLVVDYLQLVEVPHQKGESREQQVGRISRRLKTLARELGVGVLALAQLNRQAEQRDGHRPRLSDLRDSGQIEQDADVVLLLHRPDYYDKDDRPGEADLIVAKNRNGATGTIRLVFKKHLTRFEPFVPAADEGGFQ